MAQSSSESDMDANHRPSGSGEETSSSPPTHRPSKSPPPLALPPPPSSTHQNKSAPPRAMPVREDCWSEEATQTLVNAWGERHLDLNRGNLRQKHWQEVADAVNAAHGHTKRLRRTDIQCKNRIDTIKKKYKIEKARTVESRGSYVSPWPFYAQLDSLIGDAPVKKPIPFPPSDQHNRKPAPPSQALALTSPVPVGPRSFKPKRPAQTVMDDSFFRRTFAAAAAAATTSSEEDRRESSEEEDECPRSSKLVSGLENGWKREKGKRRRTTTLTSCGGKSGGGGCRQLAEAIVRFGEIYERVETMKQEQMVELEKNRMEFAKELEFERMKVLMDTQLQLAKIKRLKPSSHDDGDSY